MENKKQISPWVAKLPAEELEVDEENFFDFFKMMFERQEIWHKRFTKQPKPWTKDVILRDNKFTNCYRELDRQSQYVISQIIIPYEKLNNNQFIKTVERGVINKVGNVEGDISLLFYYIVFFKLFNNSDFFEYLKTTIYFGIPTPKQYEPERFEAILTEFRNRGGNPFTTSYYVNSTSCTGKSRDYCFAHRSIPDLINIYRKLKDCETPEVLIELLKTITSVSSFLSHEFYQDFTYITRYTDFEFPFDQNSYTNIGPGAELGLRLIFPNKKTKEEKKQGAFDLLSMSTEALKQYGDFKYVSWDKEKKVYVIEKENNLTRHNIQFLLCEFSKYWKMKLGEGKQRSKFKIEKDKSYHWYLY